MHARAALHGWIVLHSSISSEQSTPVHPGSKQIDYCSSPEHSLSRFRAYRKHKCNYSVDQYNDYVLDMDLIDIHRLSIDIDDQQSLSNEEDNDKPINNR